jgi:hypothetical protein
MAVYEQAPGSCSDNRFALHVLLASANMFIVPWEGPKHVWTSNWSVVGSVLTKKGLAPNVALLQKVEWCPHTHTPPTNCYTNCLLACSCMFGILDMGGLHVKLDGNTICDVASRGRCLASVLVGHVPHILVHLLHITSSRYEEAVYPHTRGN